MKNLSGYARSDGRKGIRNIVAVAYLVECAHFVSRSIVENFKNQPVHLIGFPGCYPNDYAEKVMSQLVTHPNVGAALIISLGCESFNKKALLDEVEDSQKPVKLLTIQDSGGTKSTIIKGTEWVKYILEDIKNAKRVEMSSSELIVGTICGGSDGTSGITANPAVGLAFDKLIEQGSTCIFEETGELIGCEKHMAKRSKNPTVADEIIKCVTKAAKYFSVLGHGSFSIGNAEGGLTTQEEKSLGAYCKSGSSQIQGIIKPAEVPNTKGLFLLDVIPDGEVRFGFPNVADNAELIELISCGVHINLFTTGRGSVVGSAISPVIKICANPDTYLKLSEDMDINAGKILEGQASLQSISDEIIDLIYEVANGKATVSEELGHQEFILGYKSFESINKDCVV